MKQWPNSFRLSEKTCSMSKQRNYSQRKGSSQSDEDFDLDSYLEEKGQASQQNHLKQKAEESFRNPFLSRLLLVVALVVSVIWSYNVTTDANWFSFFSGGQSERVSQVAPVSPVSPATPIQRTSNESFEFNSDSDLGSITDYLQRLDQEGLLNDRLLNGFEARQVYSNGVPIEYLKALNDAGYLSEFSFVYINEYYNNQIPIEYLNVLDNAGYLTHFSFVSVVELYKNDVSLEYLKQLEEGGYLFDLSFVYITEYYKNGVTTEFLDELKSKNLYDNLSFVDVVELYKAKEN